MAPKPAQCCLLPAGWWMTLLLAFAANSVVGQTTDLADNRRVFLNFTVDATNIGAQDVFALYQDPQPLANVINELCVNTSDCASVQIEVIDIGIQKLKIVASLELTQAVSSDALEDVGLLVLALEQLSWITFSGNDYTFIGYIGVFRTLEEARSSSNTDAINWCSSFDLVACRAGSTCRDVGWRYTCPCKPNHVENGTKCLANATFGVAINSSRAYDFDNMPAQEYNEIADEIGGQVEVILKQDVPEVAQVRVASLQALSAPAFLPTAFSAQTQVLLDDDDNGSASSRLPGAVQNLSGQNLTVQGEEVESVVIDNNGQQAGSLTFCEFFIQLRPDLCNQTKGKICDENSSSCLCAPGYSERSPEDDTCVDVDECSSDTSPCTNARCVNSEGSYSCQCLQEGYRPDDAGTECVEIDECSENTDNCQHVCVNTDGSYRCECNQGYQLDSDGASCNDIDECSENTDNCKDGCVNTDGSYRCECSQGYKLSADGANCDDTDECSENTDNCQHVCVNTDGSYRCECNQGYQLDSDGASCNDIDECSENTDNCKDGCVNTDGSYRCECSQGYKLSADGANCDDTDECSENTDNCQHVCVNTDGSYSCECNQGYQLDSEGASCNDIDECSENTDNCKDGCVNTDGSYRCECSQGYKLSADGANCDDTDECSENTDNCQHVCVNTDGSYSCECNQGYQLDSEGASCNDIDECSENTDNCKDGCVNTDGSYRCECSQGYKLSADGANCDDIDECLESLHGCSTVCRNTAGSYLCTCNPGYRLNNEGDQCIDIDECAENIDRCADQCRNSQGSYSCECSQGFTLSTGGFGCHASDGCGGIFTEDSGQFTSPGYPSNYTSRTDCVWTISVEELRTVRLSFSEIRTPTSNCRSDFIEVRDGTDSTDVRLASYCGYGVPDPLLSSGNNLYVEMASSSSSPMIAFSASWSSVCSQRLAEATGTIQSPRYPSTYEADLDCTYLIEQKRGFTITLEFTHFNLDSSSIDGCSDFIEIHDGSSEFAPQLGTRLCGSAIPAKVSSTGNNMWIRFRSDSVRDPHRNGFIATFKREAPICTGGTLTDAEGTVASPGFPEPFPEDDSCSWTISVDSGSIIKFTFDTLALDGYIPRCNSSWVKYNVSLYDSSHEDETKLIGGYCGRNVVIPPIFTTGNHLTVTFASKGGLSAWNLANYETHGFQASYVAVEKGAIDDTSDSDAQYDLFPYGIIRGDKNVNRSRYWYWDTRPTIHIPQGIPVGDELQYYVTVQATWGDIYFAHEHQRYWSRNNLCAYCASVDLEKGGNVSYQLYGPENPNEDVLKKATSEVREFIDSQNFSASVVLVVTFDRVQPRSWWWWWSDEYYNDTAVFGEVTYQVAVVSNGTTSYALVYYKSGAMNWGYSADHWGLGVSIYHNWYEYGRYQSQHNIYSYTDDALKLDTLRGNTGHRGMWIYKLGTILSNPDEACEDWYRRNLPLNEDRENGFQAVPQCPCSSERMWRRREWTWSRYDWTNRIQCYRLSRTRSLQYYPFGKECCYSLNWTNSETHRKLVVDPPHAGYVTAHNPGFPALYSDYLREDAHAHYICCQKASSTHYCKKFYKLRPVQTCRADIPFSQAWLWGDPHIMTLDERQFPFNAWGEYILMTKPDLPFTLQGRMEPFDDGSGSLSNATVFTAFGAEEDGVNVFVGLDPTTKDTLLLYANGTDYSMRFSEDQNFTVDTGNFSLARDNDVLDVSFPSGIGLRIAIQTKTLRIAVIVPEDYHNQTRGLMGNFNGDKNDDFVLPDGTVLSSDMTERQIYEDFGKQWVVTDSSTILRYETGKGPSDYAHPEFTPFFLDEMSAADRQEAEELCGATSISCIYDYIATSNADFALASKQFEEEARRINEVAKNTVPQIDVPETLEVTSGVSVTFNIQGQDPDENDTLTYHAVDDGTGMVQVDPTTGQVTFTPDDTQPLALIFYAVDSTNAQSVTRRVPVVICSGCSGHGTCDFTRTSYSPGDDYNFQHALCICDPAWDGIHCDQDRDGCVGDPCLEGQVCTDLTPQQQGNDPTGYVCGACPSGFARAPGSTDGPCVDVNECLDAADNECGMICVNTEGSYECRCETGYRLDTDGQTCRDINECAEKAHNCQHICNNTDGVFHCLCEAGYTLDDSGTTCTQDEATSLVCADADCTQGCKSVMVTSTNTEVPECFCFTGYDLDPVDKRTCHDHDECQDGVCSQKCLNFEGGVACTCYSGYQLSEDQRTCSPCPPLRYGPECQFTCTCNGRGEDCHPVKGCVCQAGWTGTQCETDINECSEKPSACQIGQLCSNNRGSYMCTCPAGYAKDASGTCQDIDECGDVTLNTCGTLEECVNVPGSFYCTCATGYWRSGDSCADIDECSSSSSNSCQHRCVNVDGTYNCECHAGYVLAASDRATCVQESDLCAGADQCSHGCTLDTDGNPVCFCHLGYELDGDRRTCLDVDECIVDNGGCSHGCNNADGHFQCSCPQGMKLDNDMKTCLDCPAGTFGTGCTQICACGVGADHCDTIIGCVCRSGWQGEKCEDDINECSTMSAQQECQSKGASCVNFPGHYTCQCAEGYEKDDSGMCQDIDECRRSVCDQMCENSPGSYRCLCNRGFRLNPTTGLCEDVDECVLPLHNECTQRCMNTVGAYLCGCDIPGYVLDNNGFSCIATVECSRQDCDTQNGGCSQEQCFCNSGYQLTDSNSCQPEWTAVSVVVTVKGISVTQSDLDNVNSLTYIFWSQAASDALLSWLNGKVSGLATVIITSLRYGSLVVEADIMLDTNNHPSAVNELSVALVDLAGDVLMMGGQTGDVELTVNNQQLESTWSPCEVYEAITPCPSGQECAMTDELPQCRDAETATSEKDDTLAIALGVTIPVIVILAVTITVCAVKHAKKSKANRKICDDSRPASAASSVMSSSKIGFVFEP